MTLLFANYKTKLNVISPSKRFISFINEIESGSGSIDFEDIDCICESLIISITEMGAIVKPNSFFR